MDKTFIISLRVSGRPPPHLSTTPTPPPRPATQAPFPSETPNEAYAASRSPGARDVSQSTGEQLAVSESVSAPGTISAAPINPPPSAPVASDPIDATPTSTSTKQAKDMVRVVDAWDPMALLSLVVPYPRQNLRLDRHNAKRRLHHDRGISISLGQGVSRKCLMTSFPNLHWQYNNPPNPADAAIGPQLYDVHLYFSFGGVADPNAESYMKVICNTDRVTNARAVGNSPLVFGEWSLATNFNASWEFLQDWADAQRHIYAGQADGWFFWSFKIEEGSPNIPAWTYLSAYKEGYLGNDPSKLTNPNLPPFEAIQKWEELGQQFEQTIAEYFESCATLQFPGPSYSSSASKLVTKIDQRLYFFDDLADRLHYARSALARARNKLASPILCLPDEILSRIFYQAMNQIHLEDPGHLTAQHLVIAQYRALHTFLGVCSTWRRVIVSQATFWSLVPVVKQRNGRYMSTAAQVSLARSADCGLQLVAQLFSDRFDISQFVFDQILLCHGHRFSSINLHADGMPAVQYVVRALAKVATNSPGSLTDLSVCHRGAALAHFPDGDDLFYPHDPPAIREAFNRILESLHRLRLWGVRFDFAGVSFKYLIELRLQGVILENSAKVEEFIWALSSSSQLRILEMISVTAYADGVSSTSSHNFPILLPALRRLYLEDLYQDTLNLVLGSIESESHRVTLHLTSTCLEIRHLEEIEPVGVLGLRLQDSQIDTLILGHHFTSRYPRDIRGLLVLVPNVKSFYLDGTHLDPTRLGQIKRPEDLDASFPKFTELYISRSSTGAADLNLLKDVVATHPINVLGLGVSVNEVPGGGPKYHSLETHELLDDDRSWFLDAVPRVIWLPDAFNFEPPSPGFCSDIWRP
ncbi:hypothetical protein FRC11_013318 [Ceratobasidium sp. 423]|nr:hypothetical protein FRC11_013318 [Ceratobasidium sp. 423]